MNALNAMHPQSPSPDQILRMTSRRSPAESRFLTSLVESVAPGWKVRLMDDGSLAGLDAGLYLLDTRTLWCGMSYLRSSELAKLREMVKRTGSEAAEFSTHAAVLMGDMQAGKLTAELEREMYLAAAAGLVSSRTGDAVFSQTGSLVGHWVFVRYEVPGQTAPSRPMFGRAGDGMRLFTPDDVLSLAAIAIGADASNPRSAIRSLIGAHRPALNPHFASVAPADWIDFSAPSH